MINFIMLALNGYVELHDLPRDKVDFPELTNKSSFMYMQRVINGSEIRHELYLTFIGERFRLYFY